MAQFRVYAQDGHGHKLTINAGHDKERLLQAAREAADQYPEVEVVEILWTGGTGWGGPTYGSLWEETRSKREGRDP